MEKQPTKGWTKQDGEDASRLLAEMVKRAKRPAGETPAEIHEPGSVRRVPANDDREKRVPQLGGVSRGTRSYLPLTGGVPVEGTQQGEEKLADGVACGGLSKPDGRTSAPSADSNVHDFTVPCEQRALGKD